MPFIPYENITFETRMSIDEVSKKFNRVLEIGDLNSYYITKKTTKQYRGLFFGTQFNIKRIIRHRNSFAPIIKGIIREESGRTIIEAKLRLHALVIGFLAVWCGFICIATFVILIDSIADNELNTKIFLLLIMLLFAYLSSTIGFGLESGRFKSDFQTFFDAKQQ